MKDGVRVGGGGCGGGWGGCGENEGPAFPGVSSVFEGCWKRRVNIHEVCV